MQEHTSKLHYTPDVISRNVKQKGDGVIEVYRYNDGNLRADGAWVWFLVIMLVFSYSFFTKGTVYSEVQWAVSVDWRLTPQYEKMKVRRINQGIEYQTYDEFKKDMLEMHGHRRYTGAFFIVLPILLFLWVASPRWRPLRFDSKRRLMYFWSFGQFYIEQYPERFKGNRRKMEIFFPTSMQQPWIRYQEHGGLIFNIPHENRNKDRYRQVAVGIFRPACDYQNYVLKDFIFDYLSSDDPDLEFAHYFKKEKRIASDYFNLFYQFSLFPRWGYNERKTEARIQAWLMENSKNNS